MAFGFAILGHDIAQMAVGFGTTERTIDRWIADHPEFRDAIKKGGAAADVPVALSLRKRALGFEHRIKGPLLVDKDGKVQRDVDGSPLYQEIPQYFPPDSVAAIFWLKNRQYKTWKDKRDVQTSGTLTVQTEQEARNRLAQMFDAPPDSPPEDK